VSRQTDRDPYRGSDPRQIPAYTIFDAARYLHIPERTIQNWAYGYSYATKRRLVDVVPRRSSRPNLGPLTISHSST
jgi:hypothetical protein